MDLVKVWHPDRFQGDSRLREKAERTLQGINEAYEALRNHQFDRPTPDGDHAVPEEARRAPDTLRRMVLTVAIGGALVGAFVSVALIARASWPGQGAPKLAQVPAPKAPEEMTANTRPSPPPTLDSSRPESGSDLRAPRTIGQARLALENRGEGDAVVVLRRAQRWERVLFVGRGEKVTLLDLAPGGYQVRTALGDGWTGRHFLRPAGCLALGRPVALALGRETPGVTVAGASSEWVPAEDCELE